MKVIVAALLVLANTATAADRVIGDWAVDSANGLYEAYTSNSSGSLLGLVCTDAVCKFYLLAEVACEDGHDYLALINTEKGAVSRQLGCMTMTLSGKPQKVILMGDPDWFAQTIRSASTIGIAVPMANGDFQVFRFSLRGSAAALDAAFALRDRAARRQPFRDSTL